MLLGVERSQGSNEKEGGGGSRQGKQWYMVWKLCSHSSQKKFWEVSIFNQV